MAPTTAEINLDAIGRNLTVLRNRSGGREVMAVVKANAYGHGAVGVARHLRSLGVERLAVATLPEALELRAAGIDGRILVFGPPLSGELPHFAEHDIDVACTGPEVVEAICAAGLPLRVHLKTDTGMTRLGLPPSRAIAALRRLESTPGVVLAGVWTHFASSDLAGNALARWQLERWRTFQADLGTPPCPLHIASSGGIMVSPELLEGTAWARAGIALYGLLRQPGDPPEVGAELMPAMRLVSRVSRSSVVPKGTPVSYGGRWVAPDAARIVTVAAGYADGVPRTASGRLKVGVEGRLFPAVGMVCMDMLMVHVDDPDVTPSVGDPVVLFGDGGPSCADLAGWAGTISYEIACGVSARVRRVFF